jgi:hypothetical protein
MTQKDYIKFAAMFAEHIDQNPDPTSPERIAIERIIVDTAVLFATDNPRFKWDTFYRAAGVPEMAAN